MNISKYFSTIVLATIFSIIIFIFFVFILYNNSSSTESQNLKDVFNTFGSYFGGITTLIGAYVASCLYVDWRDNHNKAIEVKHIKKIMASFEAFDMKITRMFQFEYDSIDFALRYESFIKECVFLELDIRVIEVNLENYYLHLNIQLPQKHSEIFKKIRQYLLSLKKEKDIIKKRNMIEYLVIPKLYEFTKAYDNAINQELITNLKALK